MNHRSILSSRDSLTVLGAPGSGKGTLKKNLGIVLGKMRDLLAVGTGDILREHRERRTPLGIEAQRYMDDGMLVPDDVMIPMMSDHVEKLSRKGSKNIPYFDGFPRTLDQALMHSDMLERHGYRNTAVNLDVPAEHFAVLAERMARRAMEDEAAGRPVRSDDKNPEAVENRLRIAKDTLGDIVGHFERRGELITVNALGDPREICAQVHGRLMDLIGVELV